MNEVKVKLEHPGYTMKEHPNLSEVLDMEIQALNDIITALDAEKVIHQALLRKLESIKNAASIPRS